MTQPRNPGEAIRAGVAAINATRDATRILAEEIAERRRKEAEERQPPAPSDAP